MPAILVLLAVLATLIAAPSAHAEPAAAQRGCAMAHCDPQMTDVARLPAPTSAAEAWTDPSTASAAQGLGCSADGTVAACTFGDRTDDRSRPYLKVYGGDGEVRWTSRDELNAWSWTSVPLITRAGDVIAADDERLVRFAPGGSVRWRSTTPGGAPISPTRTADGTIVLATSGGPVSAYDPDAGERLATLDLRDTEDGVAGRFDTRNTPGARGNRIYVSTEFTRDDGTMGTRARLYAIDVRPDAGRAGRRLEVAWHFDFGARSGASPLVVGDLIVFDGDRRTPGGPFAPRFFAVRDHGDRPELVWEHPLGGPGVASAALDPRGGAWVFTFGKPELRRLSLDTGEVLQKIDLDAAVDAPGTHVPLSAMTIAEGPTGRPAMIVSARAAESTYVVALDLHRGDALWAFPLPAGAEHVPMGQFPIITEPAGRSTVVFTAKSGVRAITGPASGHAPGSRRAARR